MFLLFGMIVYLVVGVSWLYKIGSSTGLGGRNSGKSNGKSSLWNRDIDVPDGGLNDKYVAESSNFFQSNCLLYAAAYSTVDFRCLIVSPVVNCVSPNIISLLIRTSFSSGVLS